MHRAFLAVFFYTGFYIFVFRSFLQVFFARFFCSFFFGKGILISGGKHVCLPGARASGSPRLNWLILTRKEWREPPPIPIPTTEGDKVWDAARARCLFVLRLSLVKCSLRVCLPISHPGGASGGAPPSSAWGAHIIAS